ncbi:hypothetical protein [uncultured Tolumonas sp.]|uniref:hypothetical protein n=1 Tax=uncultured Tolumonas sp. TaxID=263765 RepID=UPI002A0A642F|nr:hypothetical protein [uncultured Tolumonas sp.]
MSVINLNQLSGEVIEKSEETRAQQINPVKSEIAPITTNKTKNNKLKKVNNKLPKPVVISKKPVLQKKILRAKKK